MVVSGSVSGREEIAHIKALLGFIPEQLRKDIGKGTRKALAPLKQEIPAAAGKYMPSGYAPVFVAGMKVTTFVRVGDAIQASVKVISKGRYEDRDVRSRNRGSLRHPVFGRRSHKWINQQIRPGFVNHPVEEARKRLIAAAEEARDNSADLLLRG